MKLSDDALLALKVMRWALANGWKVTRRSMSFDGHARYVTWTGWEGPVTIEYFDDCGHIIWDVSDVSVGSVVQAVDALVMFDHLPPMFSSAWAAGRESAYTTDEWRVVAGPDEFPAVFQDEILSEEHLVIVVRDARNRWRSETIWVQHRRTGATDWSRVDG